MPMKECLRGLVMDVLWWVCSLLVCTCLYAEESPKEWIDPDTGHRVVRLSNEPGTVTLYFSQNAYTSGGEKLVVVNRGSLATIDLKTGEIHPMVEKANPIAVGKKTGRVFYQYGDTVLAVDPSTNHTTALTVLPPRARVDTVNADETLLAGTVVDTAGVLQDEKGAPLPPSNSRGYFHKRFHANIPMGIFVVDLATGKSNTIFRSNDWLSHVQFSPTEAEQLMFCHEGPWYMVDRIWLIRANGSGLTNVHERTMEAEIAGHEFWSADGKTVWYDLQTPKGEDFWLAGYEVATGHRIRYHLQRDEWSIHYNVSPDGRLFAGDGGDSRKVAHAKNGKWIYLFRPEVIPNDGKQVGLIQTGRLNAERLVNLSKHNYALEPNVSFTPDMNWIVFRSNMQGSTHVYAVQVKEDLPLLPVTPMASK